MRLADIIKQCKEAGATEVELYETGEVKRLAFGAKVTKEKKLSKAEEIEADKLRRNPRKNAVDLAISYASDLRAERKQ